MAADVLFDTGAFGLLAGHQIMLSPERYQRAMSWLVDPVPHDITAEKDV